MAKQFGIEDIMQMLSTRGEAQYGKEAVSQLQHGLQCATLALQSGAQPTLMTAALLHDFGHLVHNLGEDAADRGIDDRHEYRALGCLASLFGQTVTEPIRLHVEAKRYLCAVDNTYWQSLSPASKQSLELQGGIFTAAAAEAFIQQPYAKEAVTLRRWDDLAKVPDLPTPPLADFQEILVVARTSLKPE
ncbi:MAG: phosphonate degradation HD-domain oxygenase [Cyanobacteria bacterium P01_D01_bin.44]